ncbi:MAG: HAD family phosphatase [Lachnospiraceae bacterium]|nr:HAD family phosphatase [Lachnospiraceae bacterium]
MISYPHIVFDLGCVLLDYTADAAVRAYTSDPELIRTVSLIVFHSGEWTLLDAGLISEDDALANFMSRCRTDEERRIAKLAFENWERFNLTPHPGMEQLLTELKNSGYHMHILSNISVRMSPERIREMLPNSELIDTVFTSSPHRCIKPQTLIYETFCKEAGLRAEDCFFIDDRADNITAAKEFGMGGYVFDGDVEKLRKLLV